MIYDYIIIGSGLGGLAAGLNLSVNNKKVLMLEKNSLPGGRTQTFKRGRFEFDTTLYDLYNYGNSDHIGDLQKLFNRFGLRVETFVIPFNHRIKVVDTKEDYEIKGNFEDFAVLLEELKEGSVEPIRNFIKITKEIHEAIEALKKGEKNVEEKHPNFAKYLDVSALNALTDLSIPKETINRLTYLWVEIGSPINKLSFIDFADFMYKLIFKRITVLKNKSLDLMIKLVKKFQNKGGKLYYNANVISITDEEDIKIVTTIDNKIYKAKHVICDLSPRYVYNNLITNPSKDVLRLENARTLGPTDFYVYIGLNKDHESLGLESYKYYHFNSLNYENVEKMMSFKHNTWEGIVPNVINSEASPKNTTILVLKTSYYANVFDNVTKENYHTVKEKLAENLIEQFEESFNLNIKEYIEEIEIATPFTIRKYTSSSNGTLSGYMRMGYDNSIHRLISFDDESLNNISFVGSSSVFGSCADNAFCSGIFVTNKLLEKENQNGK